MVEELGPGRSCSGMPAVGSSTIRTLAGASSCGTQFGPAPLDLLVEGRCELVVASENGNNRRVGAFLRVRQRRGSGVETRGLPKVGIRVESLLE